MTGPISFEFALTCGSVAAALVGIVLAAYRIFQTKDDARESELRMEKRFDARMAAVEKSVEDVHAHLESVRREFKEQMVNVNHDLRGMRERGERVSENVAWIKGIMERGLTEHNKA